QSGDGVVEQAIGIVRVDHIEIGLPPQVIEDQKALFELSRQHLRHMHPGTGEQLGDIDEGPAVLLRRRCIHEDQAALARLPAEIPTKTGVTAGRDQLPRGHHPPTAPGEEVGQLLGELVLKLLQTYIVFGHQGSPTALAVAQVMLYYPASFSAHREACGPWADSAQEARTNKMAVKYPAFRKKFPLLVTGSLLALQPVISLQA